MTEELLSVSRLSKRFGGVVASDSIDLAVRQNELHALIGPNGAGKTTLVAQLSGQLRPDSGTIHFRGADVTRLPAHARVHAGFARSFQITNVVLELTALDNVALAIQARDGHSFRFWRAAREDNSLRRPAAEILERIGLAEQADVYAGRLAHGEKRALEIGMALATGPALMLLDEPLAGMGSEESAAMVRLLAKLKGRTTILLVEHDMDAVFTLADTISVLVSGRVVATAPPAEIRANPDVQAAYLGDDSES